MTRFLRFAWALAMIVSLAAYAGAMTTLQGQQQEQSLEGELVSIDNTAKVLVMKGADAKEMRFAFTDKTQVVGAEKGIQGLAGQAGTRLKINFQRAGETLTATRIEVLKS
jgi:hypothetical protein